MAHEASTNSGAHSRHIYSGVSSGRRVPKAALIVVVVVVVISSLKIPKAFLMHSAMKLCVHIRTDIPTDLPSQIFHLFSN